MTRLRGESAAPNKALHTDRGRILVSRDITPLQRPRRVNYCVRRRRAFAVDIDREEAETVVRDHLRQYGRFDGVEVTLDTYDVGDGWQVVVQPANSYLRRHRRDLTLPLFVDRADGRVHHIPSSGTKLLIAQLRGTI